MDKKAYRGASLLKPTVRFIYYRKSVPHRLKHMFHVHLSDADAVQICGNIRSILYMNKNQGCRSGRRCPGSRSDRQDKPGSRKCNPNRNANLQHRFLFRIVGGEEVAPNSIPWQVSIQVG